MVKCDQAQSLFQNVEKIVTHVRRSHKQLKLERKPQLYSDTRFNGAFIMLNVFLSVCDEIGCVINNHFMEN